MKNKGLHKQSFESSVLAIQLIILLLIFFPLVGACNTKTDQVIAINEIKPLINYFVADASSIVSGKATSLRWSVTNADMVEIQPGIGTVASSGSITIYPEKNTDYLLSAMNQIGINTCSLSITVVPPERQSNCTVIMCDPVSGRNQDISFKWEQLCLCTEYRLQIAKDAGFTMIIYDLENYVPSNITSPGLLYLAGGTLNCGETYYVRVQCLATSTGQRILTPWSETHCITIGAGVPVINPHE